MGTALPLLLVAGLVCLANAARMPGSLKAVKREGQDFDYFMFVRQWPGNFCSEHSCPLLHERGFHFTIHGLWPNFKDGTWPQFCDPDYPFDEAEIDDLEDVLEEEWPSFYNSFETFWEHEWSKHGTCAQDVLGSEHKFFKTILKLHWKYDLPAALRDADILPRNSHVYRNSELVDAIDAMYGARPLVHCQGKQLSEIWMCLDKDLRPFDCDRSHERSDCEEFTIPPLKSSVAEEDGSKTGNEALAESTAVAAAAAAATTSATVNSANQATQQQQNKHAKAATSHRQEYRRRLLDEGATQVDIAPTVPEVQYEDYDYTYHPYDYVKEKRDDDAHGERIESLSVEAKDSVDGLSETNPEGWSLLYEDLYAAPDADSVTDVMHAIADIHGDVYDIADLDPTSDSDYIETPLERAIIYWYDEDTRAILEGMRVDGFEDQQVEQLESGALVTSAIDSGNAPSGANLDDATAGSADTGAAGLVSAESTSALTTSMLRAASILEGALSMASTSASTDASASAGVHEPEPTGGAASATSAEASRDFVWASKLRHSEKVFEARDDNDGPTALAVLTDADGATAVYAVDGVLLVQGATPSLGAAGGASGSLGFPRLPMWVLVLVIVQLTCVAVIAVSLAIMAGLAILGVLRRSREAAPRSSTGGDEEDGEEAEVAGLLRGRRQPAGAWWWRGQAVSGLTGPLVCDQPVAVSVN